MAEYFKGSTSVLVAFSSVLLAVYFIVKILQAMKPQHRYPPALPSIPILGSFPLFKNRDSIHRYFADKSKQLGSIFSCYLGSRYTIVLNDRNSIREAFVKKGLIFADRIMSYTTENNYNPEHKGIANRRFDSEFKHLHQLFLNIMKANFGMGQKGMEERIETEIEELIQRIKEFQGKTFDPNETVELAILNFVSALAFGNRGRQDDPELKRFRSLVQNANEPVIVNYCPILRFIPHYRKLIKASKLTWDQRSQFIMKRVKEIIDSGVSENSFVGAFIQSEGPNYDKADLREVTRNLLNAGSETTSATVLWSLVLFANHPELQKRVQDEIDSVVPFERLPSTSDMMNLPLTEATMLEVMRYKTLVPLALPHRTLNNTEIFGFHIPKGTVVRPNIYAVHMDKDEWGDPEVFRPERFLDESGLNVVGRDRIMPFSLGKRSCIGEAIARPEIFLFISSLVQQFTVCPPDTEDQLAYADEGNTIKKSAPFKIRMISRKQK